MPEVDDSAAAIDDSPSIDMDKAVDQISADLFPETPEKEPTPQEKVATELSGQTSITAAPTTPTKTVPPLSTVRPAPQSWAKDKHAHWEKISPEAQAYIEQREKEMGDGARQNKELYDFGKSLRQVVAPYDALLQSRGLTPAVVVDDMLKTYSSLTSGTVEQRQGMLKQVAAHLGLTLPAATPNGTPNGIDTTPTIDPRIQTIEQQLQELRDAQTRQQQAALKASQDQATATVNAFLGETNKDGTPAHPFFDECYQQIVALLQAGESLPDAYDQAVWANPVTREKSKSSFFQTESEKAKERARLDALPKQKARGVNVRSSDTQRSPTEPLGSMEDTLRSTFKDIKERTVH